MGMLIDGKWIQVSIIKSDKNGAYHSLELLGIL